MKRACLALALALALLAATTSAQEGFWIALNFRVVFYPDGSADVEVKLHPFTSDGRSLWGDKRVERNLNASVEQFTSFVLLMFSDNPRLLKHSPPQYEKRPGEVVLCDPANIGRMVEFLNAYVITVRVYLNTSMYISRINGTVFKVKVRDSFTSMDAKSWIDVIVFKFEGVKLLNYSWEPPFARGPVRREEGRLLWINYNEPEAPDFYVFILDLPALEYVGEPPEVNATIASVERSGSTLRVTLQNLSNEGGYAYVRVVAGGVEQARKVYLPPRQTREVVFPEVEGEEARVELYSGSKLLDKKLALSGAQAAPPQQGRPPLPLAYAALAALVLATLIYVIVRARRARRELEAWAQLTQLSEPLTD